jgi:hypothetical protein
LILDLRDISLEGGAGISLTQGSSLVGLGYLLDEIICRPFGLRCHAAGHIKGLLFILFKLIFGQVVHLIVKKRLKVFIFKWFLFLRRLADT